MSRGPGSDESPFAAGDGQVGYDRLRRDRKDVALELFRRLGPDVAGHEGNGNVGHAEADRGRGGLPQKAFTGKGRGRIARGFA